MPKKPTRKSSLPKTCLYCSSYEPYGGIEVESGMRNKNSGVCHRYPQSLRKDDTEWCREYEVGVRKFKKETKKEMAEFMEVLKGHDFQPQPSGVELCSKCHLQRGEDPDLVCPGTPIVKNRKHSYRSTDDGVICPVCGERGDLNVLEAIACIALDEPLEFVEGEWVAPKGKEDVSLS